MSQFNVGDRIRTKENKEEGWSVEEGSVISVEELSWGVSIVIEVDEKYREGIEDDGLREVTEDQLEKEN